MSFDIGSIPDFVVEGNEIEESDVVCKVDRFDVDVNSQQNNKHSLFMRKN